MNFNSFKSLSSLQTLKLSHCCFHNMSLFFCLLDKIPNLNELILSNNKIRKFQKTNINKDNFNLKGTVKFSPVIRIVPFNENDVEHLIFQDLIQFDKIKMKYIQINLLFQPQIPNFIDFLKLSNLQFLEIHFFNGMESVSLKEFCNYLRISQKLLGFELSDMEINEPKYGLLFQAFTDNKSIKVLSFRCNDFSNFYFDLIKMILNNQYITTLILEECNITVDQNLIDALSKNGTLLYLDLARNKIYEESAAELSNLTLKGINVEGCAISNESRELIYQVIPRKEFPLDLLSYENF